MKRIVKKVLKTIWRGTLPLRRPFTDRFERYITSCLCRSMAIHERTRGPGDELSLTLDSLIGELCRLQAQVDDLHHLLLDSRAGLSPTGRSGDSAEFAAWSSDRVGCD